MHLLGVKRKHGDNETVPLFKEMGKRSLIAALSVKLYGIIIPLFNFQLLSTQ